MVVSKQKEIAVAGNLFSKESCDELAASVRTATSYPEVVIDFAQVNIITSYAINTLLILHTEFSRLGRTLLLSRVQGLVLKVLLAIRFDLLIRLNPKTENH